MSPFKSKNKKKNANKHHVYNRNGSLKRARSHGIQYNDLQTELIKDLQTFNKTKARRTKSGQKTVASKTKENGTSSTDTDKIVLSKMNSLPLVLNASAATKQLVDSIYEIKPGHKVLIGNELFNGVNIHKAKEPVYAIVDKNHNVLNNNHHNNIYPQVMNVLDPQLQSTDDVGNPEHDGTTVPKPQNTIRVITNSMLQSSSPPLVQCPLYSTTNLLNPSLHNQYSIPIMYKQDITISNSIENDLSTLSDKYHTRPYSTVDVTRKVIFDPQIMFSSNNHHGNNNDQLQLQPASHPSSGGNDVKVTSDNTNMLLIQHGYPHPSQTSTGYTTPLPTTKATEPTTTNHYTQPHRHLTLREVAERRNSNPNQYLAPEHPDYIKSSHKQRNINNSSAEKIHDKLNNRHHIISRANMPLLGASTKDIKSKDVPQNTSGSARIRPPPPDMSTHPLNFIAELTEVGGYMTISDNQTSPKSVQVNDPSKNFVATKHISFEIKDISSDNNDAKATTHNTVDDSKESFREKRKSLDEMEARMIDSAADVTDKPYSPYESKDSPFDDFCDGDEMSQEDIISLSFEEDANRPRSFTHDVIQYDDQLDYLDTIPECSSESTDVDDVGTLHDIDEVDEAPSDTAGTIAQQDDSHPGVDKENENCVDSKTEEEPMNITNKGNDSNNNFNDTDEIVLKVDRHAVVPNTFQNENTDGVNTDDISNQSIVKLPTDSTTEIDPTNTTECTTINKSDAQSPTTQVTPPKSPPYESQSVKEILYRFQKAISSSNVPVDNVFKSTNIQLTPSPNTDTVPCSPVQYATVPCPDPTVPLTTAPVTDALIQGPVLQDAEQKTSSNMASRYNNPTPPPPPYPQTCSPIQNLSDENNLQHQSSLSHSTTSESLSAEPVLPQNTPSEIVRPPPPIPTKPHSPKLTSPNITQTKPKSPSSPSASPRSASPRSASPKDSSPNPQTNDMTLSSGSVPSLTSLIASHLDLKTLNDTLAKNSNLYPSSGSDDDEVVTFTSTQLSSSTSTPSTNTQVETHKTANITNDNNHETRHASSPIEVAIPQSPSPPPMPTVTHELYAEPKSPTQITNQASPPPPTPLSNEAAATRRPEKPQVSPKPASLKFPSPPLEILKPKEDKPPVKPPVKQKPISPNKSSANNPLASPSSPNAENTSQATPQRNTTSPTHLPTHNDKQTALTKPTLPSPPQPSTHTNQASPNGQTLKYLHEFDDDADDTDPGRGIPSLGRFDSTAQRIAERYQRRRSSYNDKTTTSSQGNLDRENTEDLTSSSSSSSSSSSPCNERRSSAPAKIDSTTPEEIRPDEIIFETISTVTNEMPQDCAINSKEVETTELSKLVEDFSDHKKNYLEPNIETIANKFNSYANETKDEVPCKDVETSKGLYGTEDAVSVVGSSACLNVIASKEDNFIVISYQNSKVPISDMPEKSISICDLQKMKALLLEKPSQNVVDDEEIRKAIAKLDEVINYRGGSFSSTSESEGSLQKRKDAMKYELLDMDDSDAQTKVTAEKAIGDKRILTDLSTSDSMSSHTSQGQPPRKKFATGRSLENNIQAIIDGLRSSDTESDNVDKEDDSSSSDRGESSPDIRPDKLGAGYENVRLADEEHSTTNGADKSPSFKIVESIKNDDLENAEKLPKCTEEDGYKSEDLEEAAATEFKPKLFSSRIDSIRSLDELGSRSPSDRTPSGSVKIKLEKRESESSTGKDTGKSHHPALTRKPSPHAIAVTPEELPTDRRKATYRKMREESFVKDMMHQKKLLEADEGQSKRKMKFKAPKWIRNRFRTKTLHSSTPDLSVVASTPRAVLTKALSINDISGPIPQPESDQYQSEGYQNEGYLADLSSDVGGTTPETNLPTSSPTPASSLPISSPDDDSKAEADAVTEPTEPDTPTDPEPPSTDDHNDADAQPKPDDASPRIHSALYAAQSYDRVETDDTQHVTLCSTVSYTPRLSEDSDISQKRPSIFGKMKSKLQTLRRVLSNEYPYISDDTNNEQQVAASDDDDDDEMKLDGLPAINRLSGLTQSNYFNMDIVANEHLEPLELTKDLNGNTFAGVPYGVCHTFKAIDDDDVPRDEPISASVKNTTLAAKTFYSTPPPPSSLNNTTRNHRLYDSKKQGVDISKPILAPTDSLLPPPPPPLDNISQKSSASKNSRESDDSFPLPPTPPPPLPLTAKPQRSSVKNRVPSIEKGEKPPRPPPIKISPEAAKRSPILKNLKDKMEMNNNRQSLASDDISIGDVPPDETVITETEYLESPPVRTERVELEHYGTTANFDNIIPLERESNVLKSTEPLSPISHGSDGNLSDYTSSGIDSPPCKPFDKDDPHLANSSPREMTKFHYPKDENTSTPANHKITHPPHSPSSSDISKKGANGKKVAMRPKSLYHERSSESGISSPDTPLTPDGQPGLRRSNSFKEQRTQNGATSPDERSPIPLNVSAMQVGDSTPQSKKRSSIRNFFFGKKKRNSSVDTSSTIEDDNQSLPRKSPKQKSKKSSTSAEEPESTRTMGKILAVYADGTQLVEINRPTAGAIGIYIGQSNANYNHGIFVTRFGENKSTKLFSGLLAVGDQVLAINGTDLDGMSMDEINKLMIGHTILELKTLPISVRAGYEQRVMETAID